MKRPLTILTIAILTILVLYACSSTIRTANTSFVTITIGGNSQKATLHAEKATTWLKLKYYLADAKLISEAYAYIPSVVQVLVVTVTAPDMTTPIVGISSLSSNQTTATLRIEVPNGDNRQFTVEGIRGVDSQTYYRGIATANLTGADVNLPISMTLVGPGMYVNFATGTDLPTTSGTSTNPFQTITYALSRTSGTDAIYVAAGTYPPVVAGPGETYPLQLKTGTALICTGTSFSSVINASTFGTTAILGNDNATVDNCMIKVGQGGTGVTDIVSLQPKATRINGSLFEVPTGATGPSVGVALAHDNSVLLDSSVTGTNALFQAIGVQVTSGKPSIIDSTISKLPIGIDLTVSSGDALITGSTITGNTTGISIVSTGKPVVTVSQITNNGTGIQISGGDPSISSNIIRNNTGYGLSISGSASGQVTGNSIDYNNTGIVVSVATGGDPRVNGNNIFCNTFTGADVSSLTAIHLENNAWNRDANTSPPGPRVDIGNCLAGADICPRSVPEPTYIPFSPAVANGCP